MNKIIKRTINNKIRNIRGKQVILDSDLAELYEVETKRLNEQVKRNKERFPDEYMFQLTDTEMNYLREWKSQNATLNQYNGKRTAYTSNSVTNTKYNNLKSQIATSSWGGKRKLSYAFTEQGISMLSSVLKSKKAIEISIKIINAFVSMRKFLQSNASIFQAIEQNKIKLLEHDKQFKELFEKFEIEKPKQGIFYDGQIFDAYKFINDLIKSGKERIVLIDNYIDETVLILFSKINIPVTIYTKNIDKKLKLDLIKYNKQYSHISIKKFNKSHDRFLIIDKEVYHFGASLKDLGKKWFAFSKMKDINPLDKIILKP